MTKTKIVKKKATKEILKKLTDLRKEAFAKTKEYNKFAAEHTLAKTDITQEQWDEDPWDDNAIEQLILFDRYSRKNVEPEEMEQWLPSSFC